MTYTRTVRVATAGRRFRTYVGRLPGGRKLPGGARPIEQVIAFTTILLATLAAARAVPDHTLAVFGVGIAVAFAVAAAMAFIPYDGVPIVDKSIQLVALLANRKPIVLAREELDRQSAANPAAFLTDETLGDTEPGGEH